VLSRIFADGPVCEMEVFTSRTKGSAVPKNLSLTVTCRVCENAFPAGSYSSMLTSGDTSTQI